VAAAQITTNRSGGSPVVEARGLVKRFGGVTALDGVDFELLPGECLGLVGDNGAGKSTLIKILSGALLPDGGEMLIGGVRVVFESPSDARRLGIETVHQDLALAGTLDAATNIFLGREIMKPGLLGRLGFVDRAAMKARARELLTTLNVRLRSMDTPASSYSGGQRQSLAIARVIASEAAVILLDEPMAALGVRQSQVVVDLIRRLRERTGISLVLIAHDLPKVVDLADRIVVLRRGKRAATIDQKDATVERIVTTMTGGMA
jgi:ABC-type sugar transport system ATPase subunit